MLVVTAEMLARVCAQHIVNLACVLPPDVKDALDWAAQTETKHYASQALELLQENAAVASTDQVPLCQDTGTVWVCLEVGPDIVVPGNVFSLVNTVVAQAYTEGRLRKSLVKDALFNRENTQDNTPAFTDIHFVPEPGVCRVHLMMKGGGSDIASRGYACPRSRACRGYRRSCCLRSRKGSKRVPAAGSGRGRGRYV